MHKLQDRNPQMWSREYKARGQGQGHKKTEAKAKNSPSEDRSLRGQVQECSRPSTGMLEAKDQGPRRKSSAKKKVFKKFFRRSPIRTVL